MKLSFVEETISVEKKLIKFIGLFNKLRQKLTRQQLSTVFNKCVEPAVQHGN